MLTRETRPQPTHDDVLIELYEAVQLALTETVRVATNAARKSGVVRADEIKETVDRAAAAWVPE